MSQTTVRSRTIPEDREADDTWTRFGVGLVVVLSFVLASILLVVALGGAHAGVDYGLAILIVTLVAALADGIFLWRRNR